MGGRSQSDSFIGRPASLRKVSAVEITDSNCTHNRMRRDLLTAPNPSTYSQPSAQRSAFQSERCSMTDSGWTGVCCQKHIADFVHFVASTSIAQQVFIVMENVEHLREFPGLLQCLVQLQTLTQNSKVSIAMTSCLPWVDFVAVCSVCYLII